MTLRLCIVHSFYYISQINFCLAESNSRSWIEGQSWRMFCEVTTCLMALTLLFGDRGLAQKDSEGVTGVSEKTIFYNRECRKNIDQ